jgi:hypothetical protein
MALTLVGLSLAFMVATLGSPSRDISTSSVETLTEIVVSVQQYVRAGCVFLLLPGLAGKFHVSSCHKNKQLFTYSFIYN